MNKNLLHDNAYINDIHHQPQALQETLAALAEQPFEAVQRLTTLLHSPSAARIVLTGMGSSFHALHPLRLQLIKDGWQAEMVETSELVHHAPHLFTPHTLMVAASQSGRSAETLQLLEKAQHNGTPVIGVTNTADSPLAQQSAAALVTKAGSETTVSCKTYIATLAALAVLGDLLAGRSPEATLAALGETPAAVEQYLAYWDEYLEAVYEMSHDLRHLMLVGRGVSLAAVGTGGLIIKEAAHFHSEGMSSAAFRHGPFEMVSPAMCVLVFRGLEPTAALNENLSADVHKAGGCSSLVAMGGADPAFSLPIVPDVGLPILEILPTQVISVALALHNRHTPGVFVRGAKVTAVE